MEILGNFFIWIIGALIIIIGVLVGMLVSKRNNEQEEHEEDIIWNSLIRWKYSKTSKGKEIDTNSIEKICPNCLAGLEFKEEGGYYFLFCDACKFISTEYHISDESNSAGAEQYFSNALKQHIKG